jgi:predicted  nucleic acid-binding Zn-ribbon protein
MAVNVPTQVRETRDSVRRIEGDFTTFRATVDTRFNNLRNGLFDGNDQHFIDLEERLNAFQDRLARLGEQLAALDRRSTEHHQQLTASTTQITRVNERVTAIGQEITQPNGRLNTIDRNVGTINQQLTQHLPAVERRFDTIDRRLNGAVDLLTPLEERFNAINQRLRDLETLLRERLRALETLLGQQVQGLETLLVQRFDTVDTTLASFDHHPNIEQELALQFTNLGTRLQTVDSHFGELLQPFNQHFATLNGRQNEVMDQIQQLRTDLLEG